MSDAPIRFDGVWKRFKTGESATALRDLLPNLIRRIRGNSDREARKVFWALKDVSFEVGEGEVLGLIGPNGAGKSTTLKLVAGILRANRGTVAVNGSLSALIEVAAGFHPDLTGRENIFLNGSVLGLKNRVIRERLDEIIEFAELREFIDTPVKRYSSGMYMRLGFAVAVHVDPRILLIDEVLAVGDLAFRRKCLQRIQDLKGSGKTILFVSHKMFDVRSICDRVLYIRNGGIHREGSALEVTQEFEKDMLEKSLVDVQGAPTSQLAGKSSVLIDDVEILDENGREIDEIRSGDSLRVRVRAQVGERLTRPVLSVSIVRSDNLRVCTVSTRLLDLEVPSLEGATEFEMRFERLDLLQEHYTIESVIWNEEMSIPIAQHLNPTFRVIDDRPPQNRPGVHYPEARFTRVRSSAGIVLEEDGA